MNIRISKHLTLLFLLLTSALVTNAQALNTNEIGIDNQLYNGKLYSYFPPTSIVGNQYLSSTQFSKGGVRIDGQDYRDVLLNLDVFNQQLLIKFKNLQGADVVISMSMAYVESFRFEYKHFIVRRNDNSEIQLYELIQVGNSTFFIRWHKNLNLRTTLDYIQYEFSKSIQTVYYQLTDGQLIMIKNNSAFYQLFPKKKAVQIKKYMRSNKLKIAKMTFSQYTNLLNYTEMLSDE